MTPDQLVLEYLANGDVEGAVSTASRQAVSGWVQGCVKLAKHKYSEAASQFFAEGRAPEAVAVLLLDPWAHFPRLASVSEIPQDLKAVVDQVLAETFLDQNSVRVVKGYIPRTVASYINVAQNIAEFNIFCLAKVAECVQLATIEQALAAIGEFDAQELVAALIESGRILAKIDQVAHTVEFSKSDQSERQTTHLMDLFDRVERLTSS